MRRRSVVGMAVVVALFANAPFVAGGGKTDRVAVARLFSPIGTLLASESPGKPWTLPALYDAVHSGDQLIALPGAKAILELKEGDVRLSLLGNLPELSPSPVLETAVVLHAGKEFDLDATFDRGRVMIENKKDKGAVRARLRFKDPLELSLDAGATVAVERFSAWQSGIRFARKPKADHAPDVDVALLVLKGKVEVLFQAERHVLEAPVQYHWSTLAGIRGPLPLRTLPAWLKPGGDKSTRAEGLHAAVEKLRRKLAEHKEIATLKGLVQDQDEPGGAVAVLSAGALEEVELVVAALGDAKHAAPRQAAVVQLRHFSGRGAEQDTRLYNVLLEKHYSPGEAEIILQLLHRFGPRDLAQPETYDALINYLASPKVAIRELGHWHLARLVPRGKSIAFDAGAPPDRLVESQAAWRKLIPPGQLPKRDKE